MPSDTISPKDRLARPPSGRCAAGGLTTRRGSDRDRGLARSSLASACARPVAARRQVLDPATPPGCGQPRPSRCYRPFERVPPGCGHRASGLWQVDLPGGVGRREDRRVAWVSLDRFDDDPAMLLVSLASARTARARPGPARSWSPTWEVPGVSVLGRAAPRLASEFRASAVPFVLDAGRSARAALPRLPRRAGGVVISGIPRGSLLAAGSRSSRRTCRGCGPRVMRWSSVGDSALDGRAPSRSSPTRRSA